VSNLSRNNHKCNESVNLFVNSCDKNEENERMRTEECNERLGKLQWENQQTNQTITKTTTDTHHKNRTHTQHLYRYI
jgi:hypothetical protein